MLNPYEVLGVNQYASEEEIKRAYKEKARQYSGDIAMLNDLDIAYDTIIMNLHRNGATNNGNYYAYDDFSDIRERLNAGRIDDAETLLDGIPVGRRNAEWFFMKGTIQQRRGWLESAAESFQRATQLDPSNREYRNAYENISRSRSGNFGTHNTDYKENSGCLNSPCKLCSSLLCADCCCECFGGDFIRCC
ncbi:MAG: J domain-containing protein [Clostridia bacterium]|nr:J domain-containing protein [Clostridia bacterium]